MCAKARLGNRAAICGLLGPIDEDELIWQSVLDVLFRRTSSLLMSGEVRLFFFGILTTP